MKPSKNNKGHAGAAKKAQGRGQSEAAGEMNLNPEFFGLTGMPDILPSDHEYHTYLKKIFRHRCRQAGFRRISTPILENAEMFKKVLGRGSDLIEKQLYSCTSKDGKEICLRPENTIGVARAYLQHNMKDWPQPVEVYYIDPQFRKEEEGKSGTYRQFWQFGLELMGEEDPALDAQMIYMGYKILEDLGIAQNYVIKINNIGDAEAQAQYNEAIKDYYFGKERYLSEEDKLKLEYCPMLILDSENEDTKILNQSAPKLENFLSEKAKKYGQEVIEFLEAYGLPFEVDPTFMRGLNYYSYTIFEFWDKKRGKSAAVIGGGHYDTITEKLGGAPVPGVGFGMGIERAIAQMKREKLKVPSKDDLHVFVAQLSKEAKKKCLKLISELRDLGVKTMGAMGKDAIKVQIGIAEKFKVPYCVLLGLTEVRENTAIIREMTHGTQVTVPFNKVKDEILKRLGKSKLDYYDPKTPM